MVNGLYAMTIGVKDERGIVIAMINRAEAGSPVAVSPFVLRILAGVFGLPIDD